MDERHRIGGMSFSASPVGRRVSLNSTSTTRFKWNWLCAIISSWPLLNRSYCGRSTTLKQPLWKSWTSETKHTTDWNRSKKQSWMMVSTNSRRNWMGCVTYIPRVVLCVIIIYVLAELAAFVLLCVILLILCFPTFLFPHTLITVVPGDWQGGEANRKVGRSRSKCCWPSNAVSLRRALAFRTNWSAERRFISQIVERCCSKMWYGDGIGAWRWVRCENAGGDMDERYSS